MKVKDFKRIIALSLLLMLMIGCGVSITKNCYYNSNANPSKRPSSTETTIKTERLNTP